LRASNVAEVKLGRSKSAGKSKLDEYREEIVALLRNGSSEKFVAGRYGTSQVNLYNWLNKNNIDAKQQNICV
jgi:DNA invertase Pin-like site-specific DNA recombinase